jgi:hypothetical protein
MCREKEEKVGLVWHSENHTVSYRRQKTWWFVPELSVGPLTDAVTTLNLPMLAASEAARGNFFMEFGLSDMFAAMEVQYYYMQQVCRRAGMQACYPFLVVFAYHYFIILIFEIHKYCKLVLLFVPSEANAQGHSSRTLLLHNALKYAA